MPKPKSTKQPSTLEKLGFEQADTTVYPRLIVDIHAQEKVGKTHFGLTAPGDIAMFNLDIGLEGVVHKFADKKRIMVYDMHIPHNDPESAEKIWEDFKDVYAAALKDKSIRSIIFDTGSELWEMCRLARFGKIAQVQPWHYGPVNAEFNGVIRDAFRSQKNLVMLHKMKPLYVNDKRTKKYERAGFGTVGYIVQLSLRLTKDDEDGRRGIIVESRHDPELEGMELYDDEKKGIEMLNFPYLASLAIEGTTEEDWK